MRQPQHDGVASSTGPALPVPPDERVDRPSVDELLDRGAKRRICVVIGAAGWGKTTAVATWSRSRPGVWLRYEDHEGDAQRLLTCLCGALEAHLPVALGQAGAQPDSAAALCDHLRSVLSKDLILVLDDVHGVPPDSGAARVIETLCQRAPEGLHLILISRWELPFSLQRLRGRGLVTEIHAPDLAFDVVDVETFLHKTVRNDPPGLARQVWERTGGWATAVHCVVEMLRAVPVDQRVAMVERLSHPGERFSDYLGEEVIGAAPEWVQQLLRGLAVSGRARSTAEVTPGVDDPTPVLAELSRQGLVRRNAGEGASWSLVRPLRDYFEYGTALSAAERGALHVTAARECIERGAPADALRHLLAAGDHAACVSLLVDHGDAMVRRGEPGAVLEATRLPDEHLNDPHIQGVFGLAQQVRGEWAQAQAHFQRSGHDRDELEPGMAWRIGGLALSRGEFAEVRTVTQRARLDRSDTLDEVRVLALAAVAHRLSGGDLETLHKMAMQTRAAARQCGHPRAWADALQVYVMLAGAEGDWRQFEAHCSDAMSYAEASDDLLQVAWIRVWRAFHQLEAGAPRQALDDATLALGVCEQCENPPFLVAHALTTRTRACVRLGALAEASDFATAIELFQRLGSRFLAWPLCGQGDLYRTRGHLVRAQAAYEEALALAQPNHDVLGLSSALTGLARIAAADDPQRARELAAQAVELKEGLRTVPALLARGWVELMSGDQRSATADSHRAVIEARQRRDDLGLAEAITLSVLASSDPTVDAAPLREAIEIWQETGCLLEEAATRVVAAHIDAPIPDIGADDADRILQYHGVDVGTRQVAGPLGVLVRSGPAWFIQTLGVFRVIRDGFPIPSIAWKSKKARDLLRILATRRRPTPREQLMELLWPEADPAVASNRLSVLLSAVRDVLQPHPEGEPPLITIDGAVTLNRSQVKIDVEEFLSKATAALEADREGARAGDPVAIEIAIEQLSAALRAHTGALFEDDPYQDWANWLAEEVRATHFAVLRALAARMRSAGDTDAAVRYSLRLLEQDNLDEPAHLTLIGALADAGRLGQARRHWETYRRCMNELERPPLTLNQIAEGKNLSTR